MEFKQVVGLRRSIRYFLPYRPVERAKVQTVLEAARLCSQAINRPWARAIVVNRDEMPEADREALKVPTTTAQLDMAPVWIFWYGDPSAPQTAQKSLKQLVDLSVLNPSHGWSHSYVDDVIWPQVLQPIAGDVGTLVAVTCVEAGLAIAHALLAAVDEGLGTQITAFNSAKAKEILGPPDHLIPLWVQLLGYSAEDREGGGVRPRDPFETLYFEGKYGTPFERDDSVVDQLKKDGMLMPEAGSYKWRREEVLALARQFGLPE